MLKTLPASSSDKAAAFLSKAELLERLPISTGTLDNWMRLRTIPFIKIGRKILFNWQSVEAALLRQQKGTKQI